MTVSMDLQKVPCLREKRQINWQKWALFQCFYKGFPGENSLFSKDIQLFEKPLILEGNGVAIYM